MKKINSILLTITIIGFLLPFIPPDCSGGHKAEVGSSMKSVVELDTNNNYSENKISIISDSNSVKSDTSQQIKSDSAQVAKNTIFEKFFLYPDDENFSGFGYIFVLFEKEYFLIFFSFIFLWIVFLNHIFKIKILAFENFKIMFVGLACILLLGIFDFNKLRFGYWLVTIFYLLTTIKFYIERKNI